VATCAPSWGGLVTKNEADTAKQRTCTAIGDGERLRIQHYVGWVKDRRMLLRSPVPASWGQARTRHRQLWKASRGAGARPIQYAYTAARNRNIPFGFGQRSLPSARASSVSHCMDFVQPEQRRIRDFKTLFKYAHSSCRYAFYSDYRRAQAESFRLHRSRFAPAGECRLRAGGVGDRHLECPVPRGWRAVPASGRQLLRRWIGVTTVPAQKR
jgi:hypothetical protein